MEEVAWVVVKVGVVVVGEGGGVTYYTQYLQERNV